MNRQLLATVLLAALMPAVTSAEVQKSGGALDERHFIAEIPAASAGGTVQVGVLLPRGAKIAKTEVQVAATNLGDEKKGWSSCDVEAKTCELAGTGIIRFHRGETEKAQELAADMRNTAAEPRYVKLTVIFQQQSGFDHSGCEDTDECGFSRPVEKD